MTVVAAKPQHTPEDLLEMPDGTGYELVDGELVERNMGAESSWIGGRIFRLLGQRGEDRGLGWALPADCGYQCFEGDPTRVRRPDASFIVLGRLPDERVPSGHVRITPDLAVEVVSPNDLFSEVQEKVVEYLDAGVRLVWLVDPRTRSVYVYYASAVSRVQEEDELTGEDVLPGFRCRVNEFLPGHAPTPPNGE